MKEKPFDPQQSFLRWQDGRLSQSEAQQLQSWLDESEENRKRWDRLKQTWQAADLPPIPQGTPQETQWQQIVNRIEAAEHTPEPKTHSWSIMAWLQQLNLPLPRLVAVGFALAFLFVALEFGGRFLTPNLQTIVVPHGKRQQLQLAEGIRVYLNAGTTFRYPPSLNANNRNVQLQGEAYFQVEPQATPFLVETSHATTTVLGTQFNVRAREYQTVVFVKQGRVQVKPKHDVQTEQLLVSEGEAGISEANSLQKKAVEHPETILAWLDGRLIFHRRPLAEALTEIERFYNLRIEADSSLLHHTITASFGQEPPSQIVEALALAVGARASRRETGYLLLPQ